MLIKASNLKKSFGKLEVVKGANLVINSGEIYGLLGPSGCGKTTLLNLLLGTLKPDKGEVKIYKEGKKQQLVGVVPQKDAVFDDLTVRENMMLFGSLYNVPLNKLEKKAKELLEYTKMTSKSNSLTSELSGGQRKRLNIMLALLHDPDILFLDEPTVGLDPATRIAIWEILKDIKSNGTAVILTTHTMSEAESLCDRVGIMTDGIIKVEGSLKELIKETGLEYVIRIKTVPGDQEIYNVLTKLKTRWAKKIVFEKNTLMISTKIPSKVINKILEFLEKNDEKVLEVTTKNPTLDDIFFVVTAK